MKIKSLLLRPGGTRVEIDGVSYHFSPTASGEHVCNVSNPKHISRLLSITEGYEVASDEVAPEARVDDLSLEDIEDADRSEQTDEADGGFAAGQRRGRPRKGG